jgi:Ca-activated chloride channel family protein
MQQGDAGNAAKIYTEPHRKAYAKFNAGDYQGAAKELAELHDSDADYNRGNALAHAGNLQGALDAYDAALKSDPKNQDAKHNRELVANALKQQPPQQQKAGDKKSQDEKKDGQQGKDASDSGKQDGQGKEGEQSSKEKNDQSKSGKGQDSSGKDKVGQQSKTEQQGKEGQKSRGEKNQSGRNQEGKAQEGKSQDGKSGNGKSEQGKPEQDKNGQQAQAGQTDNKSGKDQQAAAKDDAEQARRDVEASLGKAARDGKSGDEVNASKTITANAPKSEKQIAQEQWLRSIPDDPGGLLRRKFLIEHMMKQQKAQQ